MSKSQEIGDNGEKEVVEKVLCSNCKNKLILLPKGYPLVDLQCTACIFRAQIKTALRKPSDTISGAGWDIMNKTLKAGYTIPSLIVNFKWRQYQDIRFYPFILRKNIEKSFTIYGQTCQLCYV